MSSARISVTTRSGVSNRRALDGSYDDCDAGIVPTTCDGLRNLEENRKFARLDANIIDYVQSVVRDTPEANRYFRNQLKYMARRLGEVAGAPATERAAREDRGMQPSTPGDARIIVAVSPARGYGGPKVLLTGIMV